MQNRTTILIVDCPSLQTVRTFLRASTYRRAGQSVEINRLHAIFLRSLPKQQRPLWGLRKFATALRACHLPIGHVGGAQTYVGNLTFNQRTRSKSPLIEVRHGFNYCLRTL